MGMQDHRNAKKNFQRALSLLQDDEHIKERIQLVDIFEEDDRMGFRLHQLSVGRHICEKRAFFAPIQNLIWDYALQMKNYIYIIEHKASKECLVVDACWDIDGIIKYTDRFGLKIVGAIVTHHHIDHVGGIPPPPYDQYRIRVDGLAKLLRKLPTIKAYVNPSDIPQVTQANPELKAERLIETSDDAILFLPMSKNESSSDSNSNSKSGRLQLAAADTGSTATSEPHPEYISIKFIHTPGHTMGSQCVLLNQTRLLSGDTLFIGTCGRVDFSDSSVEKMYDSLFNKLTKLPPSTVVWPGHSYGGSFTTIEAETANGILSPKSKDEFMDQFCKAHARKHSPNDMSL
ncbi:beta-lactamase-like protein [Polychytrium aggregatum]|uniref:beta-lactamase-like protein n=1 Tax=Polychytrium aggregatum TaxID=110093 RepID=UPI0022FE80E4|nr:beta-lactamase-like protein [Polychytrium aggregatum]KAI9203905.1 beta-lactamase-like protein [Polychytrium aggregatum]